MHIHFKKQLYLNEYSLIILQFLNLSLFNKAKLNAIVKHKQQVTDFKSRHLKVFSRLRILLVELAFLGMRMLFTASVYRYLSSFDDRCTYKRLLVVYISTEKTSIYEF